jgi:uncharacterized protein YciU (UPF0263 family)
MASTYTDIGTELMTTGENAGNWGTKTNTNLKILEEAIRGYVSQSIAGGSQTTALTYTDGTIGDSARQAVVELSGSITGNQVVTVTAKEKWWIIKNSTSGAYTVQVLVSGQTGVTWAATDKGAKILYCNGTDVVDTDISSNELTSGTGDITLDSAADIVVDAAGGNVEFKDAGTTQLTLDMDGTAGAQILKLGVDSDDLVFQQYDGNEVIRIADNRKVYFYDEGGEHISSDGTDFTFASGNDINLTATTDINVPANVGVTFGDDAEKIEGDGTDLTISGNNINLTATADVVIPANVGITFGSGEKIEGDSTDLTVTSGAKINLTATSDVHIPNNVGIVFGGDSEKIEGDGTDLTISANNLTVDAAADIVLDAAGNNLTFKSGGTAILDIANSSSDTVIQAKVDAKDIIFKQYDGNILLTIDDAGFVGVHNSAAGPGELRIYEDTDNGSDYVGFKAPNVTTAVSWVLPAADGSSGQQLQTDGSGNLSWGAAASSIAADDISAGDAAVTIGNGATSADVTLDSGDDVVIDAAGGNVEFKDAGTLQLSLDMDGTGGAQIIKLGVDSDDLVFQQYDGTEVLRIEDNGSLQIGTTGGLNIANSSNDMVLKPMTDAKDIIFQQYDGTEVARIEDNATFNVSSAGKFAYAGTAVTATAAELNYSDLATLGTSAASKVLSADANNLTKITGAIYIEEATLSFDATQDWDVRASPVAKVTLTANVTFDAPSNPTTGQFISIVCIQDGTGSRTIAWNAVFEFKDDTAPTATTTASKGDMFTFRYNGAKWLEVGRNLNLTLS